MPAPVISMSGDFASSNSIPRAACEAAEGWNEEDGEGEERGARGKRQSGGVRQLSG